MRILFLTQWFDPEPMFKGLGFAKALRERGHDVEILTGFPNYPEGNVYPGYRIRTLQREVMGGIPVIRVPLTPATTPPLSEGSRITPRSLSPRLPSARLR